MSGRTKALEAELSGEIMHQTSKFSVEAGRDVQTDLLPWQRQALGQTEMFAIRQGFRRHHPYRTLGVYGKGLLNSKHPRYGWEKAIADETERTEIPEAYKGTFDPMLTNQLGLVETAFKNFQKSKAALSAVNLVGV